MREPDKMDKHPIQRLWKGLKYDLTRYGHITNIDMVLMYSRIKPF